jgi:D-alanyl-D-alanine carboxypeptidase
MVSGIAPRRAWKPDELLDILADRSKHAGEPGSFAYSNGGYLLLGLAAERATGLSYSELVTRRLLEPVGAVSTVVLPAAGVPAGLISGLDRSLMPWRNRHKPDHRSWASLAGPSGAIASTADELSLFMDALMSGRIISRESLGLMSEFLETGGSIGEEIVGYGLGLAELEIGGRTFVGHPGLFIGFQGILLYEPATGVSIALMGNVSEFDPIRVLRRLLSSRFYDSAIGPVSAGSGN